MMKNSKQLVISMTGFVHDPLVQTYKQMLKQLQCKYVDQLSLEVDYLIVNHTCTQKYKIAELNNSRIQSITLPWLQDSFKSKKILNIDKYKISKIFYGVRVIVQGFEDKKIQQKVIEILKSNGVQEVRQGLNDIKQDQLMEKYQLIIIPSIKVFKKLELNLSDLLVIPLVTSQWLQQSIKSKKCKYPNDYALNYHSICTRSFDDSTNFRRLNKKIQYFMQADFLNSNASALLYDQKTGQQLILYLDTNSIEKSFANVLQKLICLTGGLYLNSYGPVVTHILVGPVEQSEYYKFMNYGDSSHIIRVQWLIDSILCSQKLPEIDFKVRGFKQPLIKSYNNIQLKQRYQQNSQTFIHTINKLTSNQFASMPIAPIKYTKSISVNRQEKKPAKIIPVIKHKAKSEILRKKSFFIQKSQRKQSVMAAIYNKIKENAGIVYNQTNALVLKNTKLFIVLKDSEKNAQYLQQAHKLIRNNGVQAIPISIRWIEQCIKKGQLIDYMAQNYFIFKPFSFQTPLRQLMTMKIQLLGIQDVLKRRYKELLVALGANKISPNIAEITHCLCGNQYQTDPRYHIIVQNLGQKQQKQKETASKQQNSKKVIGGLSNIKFIKIQWLLELMNNKGKCNIQEFLIQNDHPTQ